MKIFCIGKKKAAISFFAAFALIAAVFAANAFAPAAYATFAKKRVLPIYSVEREDKTIAISFDCAWGAEHTDELLKIMDEQDVKCTFFMVQFWAEKYPDYVKKIAAAGHEIGTHSRTHPKMSELTKEQIQSELKTSCETIENVTGKKVDLFRPPFGDYDDKVITAAENLGLYTIQWNVDSLDWKNLSAEQIAARVIKKAGSGSIILMHNNGLHTAESLPLIFTATQQKGLVYRPISELIYTDDFRITPDGTQIKN